MNAATVHRVFAVGAAVAVAAAIGLGLWQVGPPSNARTLRFDERRTQSLVQIDAAVRAYAAREDALPDDLDAVDGLGAYEREDPSTGERYAYRRLDERRFELCAEFETALLDARPTAGGPDYGRHPAGRACFTSTLDAKVAAPRPRPGDEPRPVPR